LQTPALDQPQGDEHLLGTAIEPSFHDQILLLTALVGRA